MTLRGWLTRKNIGDYIMENGKHTKTIKSRVSKCIGLIAEITSMLKILCLGKLHFETAVLLREAMVMSVLLLNAETWLRLPNEEIKMLENVDKLYMRKILEVPAKTPIAGLYITLD